MTDTDLNVNFYEILQNFIKIYREIINWFKINFLIILCTYNNKDFNISVI